MSEQQQHAPGGHYSGANPVPTIKKFVESLDRDKAERDRKLDEEAKSRKASGGQPTPHKNAPAAKSGQKTVTDPVTGRDVVIEDVNKSMIERVKNPKVRYSTLQLLECELTIL